MKRLSFLWFLALILNHACTPSGRGKTDELPPPNILWISCEDISPALGCYGDTYANTPNLDQLAEEGIVYTRAYAPAPICSPARSTLISGVYATTLGTQHLRSVIPMPEDFRILPQYLSEAGYFCSNNDKTDYNFSYEGRWDDQGGEAHWRNRGDGQPFFSVFNHGITHEGHANRISEADVESLAVRHDPDKAQLPPYYPDTPEMRKIWAHQYDLISVLDQQVESLIGQLKEDGLYENTLIFFFSDHGFGLPRYKRWLYNSGLHVPLIVRVPDRYRYLVPDDQGRRTDRLVSFVDFAPTLLNLAGVEIPDHFAGTPFLGKEAEQEKQYIFGSRSRADDSYDVSRLILDERFVYIRNFMPHRPYVTDAIIFNDTKASFRELIRLRKEGELNPEAEQFWQPKAWEELYDLESDPYELNNLAGDPLHADRVSEMRGRLYAWMVENRDVGLLNESEMMLRSAGSSPYEMGSSESYPVETLLEAASLCGNPDATLDEIVPLLDHADPGVRYWAILSLYAAGVVDSQVKEKVQAMLADDSPTVSIAAAELLAHMGLVKLALPVLQEQLMNDENPTLVLQAAIATRNLGAEAKPLIPVIESVFPQYRGEVSGRYRDWLYPMFIGFALDQVYMNCGLKIPE
ncbi:MAG: sulfatase-like hydrolase/transferase [Bacteroidota bacterium]